MLNLFYVQAILAAKNPMERMVLCVLFHHAHAIVPLLCVFRPSRKAFQESYVPQANLGTDDSISCRRLDYRGGRR